MKAQRLVWGISSLFLPAHAALNCSTATFASLLASSGINVTFVQSIAENATFTPPGSASGLPKGFPPKGMDGFPPKGMMGPPKGPMKVPALCAIQAKVKSSEMSEYSFGVFFPEKWNGRFL
jgi:hypothetical protein